MECDPAFWTPTSTYTLSGPATSWWHVSPPSKLCRCAEPVCTPADLRDQPLPAQGILEVIVHLFALGEDFGDDHLDAEESLSALLDRCLAGVPRIAYSALTEL